MSFVYNGTRRKTLMKNLKHGVQSYKITTNDRYGTVDYHSNYFIIIFF